MKDEKHDEMFELLSGVLNGKRATFSDRIRLVEYFEGLYEDVRRARKKIDRLNDVLDRRKSRNDKLTLLARGLMVCADDDADAHDCPLYSEDGPSRCMAGQLIDELGLNRS